jgi:hypothetical protein
MVKLVRLLMILGAQIVMICENLTSAEATKSVERLTDGDRAEGRSGALPALLKERRARQRKRKLICF